ncbi:CBO0543 family protein [Paenibacillus gyeongsangnamensis]|uniref:CBO0543 family protein n=1 Tax=Paenibacillus gyeongsangnamensis TaxID=3388067 RepID=UPI003907EAF4
MHVILHLVFVLAAWRWGDWRNWRKYYSTILYLIVVDLLYNFLTYNYPLWKFNPVSFDKYIYSNHTLITLGIDFVNFPAIVLMYLGNFPKGKVKRLFYVLAWVSLNSIIEFASLITIKGISHYNGWSLWWSLVLNLIFYFMLWVHYLRPLLAWGISIGLLVIFILYFGVPIQAMK